MIRRRHIAGRPAGALAAPAVLRAQTVQKLTFYYPVAVGGPLAAIMDGYCKAHIRRRPVSRWRRCMPAITARH